MVHVDVVTIHYLLQFVEAISSCGISGGVTELWSMVESMCNVECVPGSAGGGSPLEVRCSKHYQVRLVDYFQL